MWLVDDLDRVTADLLAAAKAIGLPVFPGVPRGGASAEWSGEALDFAAFIDLAAAAQAPLLYFATARARDLVDEPVDASRADGSDGAVVVEVAWACGGIVHQMSLMDRSWSESQATTELREDLDAHDRSARIDQLARQAVDHPSFYDHGSLGREARQASAVREMFPDMDDRLVFSVVRRAQQIDIAERQAQREEDWARRARKLRGEGKTLRSIAEQLGISTNVLNRVLQQNPQGMT